MHVLSIGISIFVKVMGMKLAMDEILILQNTDNGFIDINVLDIVQMATECLLYLCIESD
jgi:hypothetical protein